MSDEPELTDDELATLKALADDDPTNDPPDGGFWRMNLVGCGFIEIDGKLTSKGWQYLEAHS